MTVSLRKSSVIRVINGVRFVRNIAHVIRPRWEREHAGLRFAVIHSQGYGYYGVVTDVDTSTVVHATPYYLVAPDVIAYLRSVGYALGED